MRDQFTEPPVPNRRLAPPPATMEVGASPVDASSPSREQAGLLAVLAALLLPLAFLPGAVHASWAPKAALALIVVGPGLVALARLVLGRDRPAILAALFLTAAGVSTAVSDAPIMALVGPMDGAGGLIFVALLVGAWALGASAGETRRRQVAVALIVAAGVNAVVAWLQSRGLMPPAFTSPGRAAGLMGNPVDLGALAAGAVWLVGRRITWSRRRSLLWLVPLGVIVGAAQLSGGRSALALSGAALTVSLVGAGRSRKAGLLAIVVAAVVVAVAPLGSDGLFTASERTFGPEMGKQVDTRLDLWSTGLDAAGDRLVVGWGPGRFEAAMAGRYTLPIALSGVETWEDAHNSVVEYAAATGAVGLILLGLWLGSAAWRSRGPLAGFALIAGVVMLVEPQTVALTPLALIALGASGPTRPQGPGWWTASAVTAALGLVAAGSLLSGEVLFKEGVERSSPDRLRRADGLLAPWPDVALAASGVEAVLGRAPDASAHRRRALALAREATRRDPADPSTWAGLGELELSWGTTEAAERAFGEALARDRWFADALQGRAMVAVRQGDDDALAKSCRLLDSLERRPPPCS